jgi:hypothetical protein
MLKHRRTWKHNAIKLVGLLAAGAAVIVAKMNAADVRRYIRLKTM